MSDYKAPFMKIKDACAATGISQYRLSAFCKRGFAPHIRSGTVYLIDVPRLLEKLREAPPPETVAHVEQGDDSAQRRGV